MKAHERPRFEFLSGRTEWGGLWQFLIVGGLMPLLVVLVAIILFTAVWVKRFPFGGPATAVLLASVGFFFFSVAKFSLFRQGILLSVGSSRMTPRNRFFYRFGYALIVVSALISFVIALMHGWVGYH